MSKNYHINRETFNRALISEVKKHECLYNSTNPDFRNSLLKENAWNEISIHFGDDFDGQCCKTRWQDLRKQHAKEYLKIITPGSFRKSYWRYTDIMSFMDPYVLSKLNDSAPASNMSKRDKYCRTCLCVLISDADHRLKSFNVFQTEGLVQKLTQCFNGQVVQWDEYPQSVCEKCCKKILYFYQFQQMCHESLEKFNSLLHNPKQVQVDLEESIDTTLNSLIDDDTSLLESNETINYSTNSEVKIENELQYEEDSIMEEIIHLEIERSGDDKESNVSTTQFMDVGEEIECEDYIVEEVSENEYTKIISEETNVSKINIIKRRSDCPIKCDLCPKTFRFQSCYEAHQRRHQGLSGYPCTFENCKKAYNRLTDLRNHLNDHNGIRTIYKCDIDNCGEEYNCYSALNNHKRQYHKCGKELKKVKQSRKVMCEKCGKVLTNATAYTQHSLLHVDESTWPFVCDTADCTKKFRSMARLKIHQMRHAGIKNYICPYCGTRKTTRTELKNHLNVHTLERTYSCHLCSKVCTTRGNLRSHIRNIHEGSAIKGKRKENIYQFVCRFCDRKFTHSYFHKHHEKTHSEQTTCTCEECGKVFPGPLGLRSHMKLHFEAEQKYDCDECDKSFRWKGYLVKHKKLHMKKKMQFEQIQQTEQIEENIIEYSIDNSLGDHEYFVIYDEEKQNVF